MKKFLVIVLAFIMSTSAMAQVEVDAVLIGPMYANETFSLSIGYAKDINGLIVASHSKFGNTVETEIEVIKFFHISGKLYAGPVAGGGVDWSDEAGTEGNSGVSYLYGAAGASIIYDVNDWLGIWSFGKHYEAKEDKGLIVGIGLYYKL